MAIIRVFFLLVLLVPVLFVIGTVVTSAEILAPFPVRACQDGLNNIVQAGKTLRAQTEELATSEIHLLLRIIKDLQGDNSVFEKAEWQQRIKKLTEKSI